MTVTWVLTFMIAIPISSAKQYECLQSPKGMDYRGTEKYTAGGILCQTWGTNSPHRQAQRAIQNYPYAGLVENYCRNPDEDNLPWCYTTDSNLQKDYCNIPTCTWDMSLLPITSCKDTVMGLEYRGTKSTTEYGDTCLHWDMERLDPWPETPENFPNGGLEENYCRNPDSDPNGHWCYSTSSVSDWNYCIIPVCPVPVYETKDCRDTEMGVDYRGNHAVTISGKTCQSWDTQSPHSHTSDVTNYPNAGLERNYCRNPDFDVNGIWCHTTDPDIVWEYCDVPLCQDDGSNATTKPSSTPEQPKLPSTTSEQPSVPSTTPEQPPLTTTSLPEQPTFPTTTSEQPPFPTTTPEPPPFSTTTQEQPPFPTTTPEPPPFSTTTQEQPPFSTTTQEQPPYPTTTQEQPPYPTTTTEQPPLTTTSAPEQPPPFPITTPEQSTLTTTSASEQPQPFPITTPEQSRSTTTRAPEQPSLSIRCEGSNCESMAKISNDLNFKATCDNVQCADLYGSNDELQLSWTVSQYNTTTQHFEIYDLQSIAYETAISLNIKAFSLTEGKQHIVKYEILNSNNSPMTSATYSFITNAPPNGNCNIEPQSGYALAPIFHISCESSVGVAASFEYRIKTSDIYSFSNLIYQGLNGDIGNVSLPVGDWENDFSATVYMKLYDLLGDYTEITESITVHPPSLSLNAQVKILENQVQSELNDTTTLLNAAQAMENLGYANNIIMQENASDTIAHSKIKLSEALIDIQPSTNDDLTEYLTVTNILLNTELDAELHVNLGRAINNVTKYMKQNRSSEDLFNAGKMIASTVLELLYVSAAFADFVLDQAVIQESNYNLLRNLDDVSDIILEIVVVDTAMVEIPVRENRLYLMKSTLREMEGLIVNNDKMSVEISMSNNDSVLSNECLRTQTTLYQESPFVLSNISLATPGITSYVSSCDNRVKRSTDEVNDLAIEVTSLTDHIPAAHNVSLLLTNSSSVVFHSMNISDTNNSISVSVFPTANEVLQVYVGFEDYNLLNDSAYFMTFQVPHIDALNDIGDLDSDEYEKLHSTFLSSVVLKMYNATQINIGIQRKECTNETCNYSTNLTYLYRITELSCLSWNYHLDQWNPFQCEISEDSTAAKVKFKSQLFGSLGVGLLIAPNTINFENIFDNFAQKIVDNLAVILTVTFILLLYIPLGILFNKLDKQDQRKWETLPLMDNIMEDEHIYEVHIFTGNVRNGGTDANVSVVIAGTESDTGVRLLVDGERKNFQKGDVTSFMLSCKYNLGVPVMIKISHDNKGKNPDWFLSKVVVVDVNRQKWYKFLCNQWLSDSEENCETQCILRISSHIEINDSKNLLNNNLNKIFSSDHLWISVGYRKTRSVFTRLHRLSCCYATLLLSMLASAMWYGKEDEMSSSAAIDIGVFSISVSQLYIGVMSSLVVIPPIILIATIYNRCEPAAVKQDKNHNRYIGILQQKHRYVKQRNHRLPPWCRYIAHFLVFVSVTTGAFFTVLYAMEWGKEKSEKWLGSIFTSVLDSFFCLHPIQVAIGVIIYSFILKLDIDTSDLTDGIGKVQVASPGIVPFNRDILSEYHIMADWHLTKHKKEAMGKRMMKIIYEVLGDILYVCILLSIIIGNQDISVFRQNNNMYNLFASNLEQIKTRDDNWDWLNSTLIPGLYKQQTADSNDKYISDGYSIRLGPPRLRQLRVIQENCSVLPILEKYVTRCTLQLKKTNIDVKNYAVRWQNTNESIKSQTVDRTHAAFLYQSPDDTESQSFWGNEGSYTGGGYIADFGSLYEESHQMLSELKQANWIDDYTRVLFVEFNTWNPNTNLFSFVIISFEYLKTGSPVYWDEIQSIQLHRYVGAVGMINLLIECLAVLVTILIIAQQFKKAVKSKNYLRKFWNLVFVVGLACVVAAFCTYVWRSVLTVKILNKVMNNQEKMISFQRVTLMHDIFINFLGFAVFLLQLRLLYILKYVKMISILGFTLMRSVGNLAVVGIWYCIFFTSVVCCFNLLFGTQVYEYHSLHKTASTITMLTVDFRGFDKFPEVVGQLGKFLMLLYAMVSSMIFINIFIVTFESSLNVVRQASSMENEVIDYLVNTLKRWLALNKTSPKMDTVETKKLVEDKLKDRVDDLEKILYRYNDEVAFTAIEEMFVDYRIWKGNLECTKKAKTYPLLENDGGHNRKNQVSPRSNKIDIDDIIKYAVYRYKEKEHE